MPARLDARNASSLIRLLSGSYFNTAKNKTELAPQAPDETILFAHGLWRM